MTLEFHSSLLKDISSILDTEDFNIIIRVDEACSQYFKDVIPADVPLSLKLFSNFYDKVRPYEAIIPNNIYEEIMTYHLAEQPKICIFIIQRLFINSRFVNSSLIKIRELDKIFVGYNSVRFNPGRNVISIFAYNHHYIDNFILSFKNNEDTQNMKISYGAYSFPEDKLVLCMILNVIPQASCWIRCERTYCTIANVYTIEEIEAYSVFKPLENDLRVKQI
ncbi:hypothetical protein RclHR1_11330008 [Rhizophagus clarus]|uniref:Uncharacterized protein n=1 Tax=Rhizophagus clarus TaxID=94130 RepID=A0A2Z6Q475_9GLOM|nr:hypothetical protein RclHR1_11330008 [Rhizophagus clarus]GET02760.1 hypothetical protein GLOIN_2v1847655 [Rhizophagus clarus]